MTSTTTPTTRDDFFTLIHKGQRQELFAATLRAGKIDWADPVAAADFGKTWSELDRMLRAHSGHEDKHFFPVLANRAPAITGGLAAGHEQIEESLNSVSSLVARTVDAPSADAGLEVYRELSAFLAHYLLHILEEETVVMPAIWEHCTDEEIAVGRNAFLADQLPAGVVRSRRAMLPALTANERATMVDGVRATATPEAFAGLLEDARRLLDPTELARMNSDLGLPNS